jgi:hypothetical protein
MIEPESWPKWLRVPLAILLVLVAALEWFTAGWSAGLLVVGFGVLVAIYLRYR